MGQQSNKIEGLPGALPGEDPGRHRPGEEEVSFLLREKVPPDEFASGGIFLCGADGTAGGEIHQNPTSVKRQSGITAPLRVAFIPFARLTAAGT